MTPTNRQFVKLQSIDVSCLDTSVSVAVSTSSSVLDNDATQRMIRAPKTPIPENFVSYSPETPLPESSIPSIAELSKLIEPIDKTVSTTSFVPDDDATTMSLHAITSKTYTQVIKHFRHQREQVGLLQKQIEAISLSMHSTERIESIQYPNPFTWLATVMKVAWPPLLAFVIPFLIYYAFASGGFDITPVMYYIVVAALVGTAFMIALESLLALTVKDPPKEPATPYPPASAIIAAYLPNEAATVVETVEAMLRLEYPAPFQLILAYNTPRDLPVEEELREIARRDSRLMLLRVENSKSKAENVNRAVVEVTGEFVGVFDADHHPDTDSLTRAWRWLSQGYDVVQGHCVIRNGNDSWVARLVAIDFEVIYALGHAGRTRLHSFGIFGGSNGYWRTKLLRRTGMQKSMLTEDIDSSMRVLQQGYKIAFDPLLVSRELAPETLRALWNQRMRWAQGWFQVTLKHLPKLLRSPHLSLRQKLGAFHLLGWREIYVWLSVQIGPIIVFQLLHGGTKWFAPLLVVTTIFTLAIGPLQVFLAYLVAVPEIRQHRGWFVFYGLTSFLLFTSFKNQIARIAQIKEGLGEQEWKVTPRTVIQTSTTVSIATTPTATNVSVASTQMITLEGMGA